MFEWFVNTDENVGQLLHFFDLCGVPFGWHAVKKTLTQIKIIEITRISNFFSPLNKGKMLIYF